MLIVDLMHEFEQGVWKNLFIHLLHILHACNPALVIKLDQRCMVHNDPEHLPDSHTLGTG
jgi:beta-lactamase regulating signal transducer with metallopeptidase domain